jgi:hypothetical protein
MLINLSNHPSNLWSAEQQTAAVKQVGELKIGVSQIKDLPFPAVDPNGDEDYILSLVDEYLEKIEDIVCNVPKSKLLLLLSNLTIHIMGELTFTFAMVNALQAKGFTCVASTTERIAKEENGLKTSEFRFVKFRPYSNF